MHFFSKNPPSKATLKAFLLDESLSDAQRADGLKVLNQQLDGPLLGHCVRILRQHQAAALTLPDAIDVCGTGGSGLPRLNTSTLASLVLAAVGVPVAKHGNRAASGRFGSFDLLEALGLNLTPSVEHNSFLYYKTGLSFLFARQYHPLVGRFAKARALVGGPTFFNYIGPLLNPSPTVFQVIGTPKYQVQDLVAAAAQALELNVAVVCGDDGLDEVSLSGPTRVLRVQAGKITKTTVTPEDFGLQPQPLEQVLVHAKRDKVKLARAILNGDTTSAHAQLVLINTAFTLAHSQALTPGLKTNSFNQPRGLQTAYQEAQTLIATGAVKNFLRHYRRLSQNPTKLDEIVGHKFQEVQTLPSIQTKLALSKKDFPKALTAPGLSVIAEVKPASPSQGHIATGKFDPAQLAERYQHHGANAISVLCDSRYFGGSYQNLSAVAAAVDLPVLAKEFIIDQRQIEHARAHGADAILLMASVLKPEQIETFRQHAARLGMQSLVEVHTPAELKAVLKHTQAPLIGINNRNLKDLSINLAQTSKVLQAVPKRRLKDLVLISESGITSAKDLKLLPPQISGVLVGSSLVNDPARIQDLKAARAIVKICGVCRQSDLNACAQAGVDLVGLNFVPSSPRCLSLTQAKKLTIPPRLRTVGVFQDQPLDLVQSTAQALNLDYVQLSGNEPLEYIQALEHPVIKGLRLTQAEDLEKARKYVPQVAFMLLESSCPGQGQAIDQSLIKAVDFPFILAGGLNSKTVAKTPFHLWRQGYDVASGVETATRKDPKKILTFTQTCHSNN